MHITGWINVPVDGKELFSLCNNKPQSTVHVPYHPPHLNPTHSQNSNTQTPVPSSGPYRQAFWVGGTTYKLRNMHQQFNEVHEQYQCTVTGEEFVHMVVAQRWGA